MERLPLLATLYPQARFVHLVRDPRDCVLSTQDAWGNTPLRTAQEWADRVRRCRSAGLALGRGRFLELRYEDLVGDVRGQLAGVFDFLGVPTPADAGQFLRVPENLGSARGAAEVVTRNRQKWKQTHVADVRRRHRGRRRATCSTPTATSASTLACRPPPAGGAHGRVPHARRLAAAPVPPQGAGRLGARAAVPAGAVDPRARSGLAGQRLVRSDAHPELVDRHRDEVACAGTCERRDASAVAGKLARASGRRPRSTDCQQPGDEQREGRSDYDASPASHPGHHGCHEQQAARHQCCGRRAGVWCGHARPHMATRTAPAAHSAGIGANRPPCIVGTRVDRYAADDAKRIISAVLNGQL